MCCCNHCSEWLNREVRELICIYIYSVNTFKPTYHTSIKISDARVPLQFRGERILIKPQKINKIISQR